MTRVGGIGCALIGFGPSTILFCLTAVISPLKLIVLTGRIEPHWNEGKAGSVIVIMHTCDMWLCLDTVSVADVARLDRSEFADFSHRLIFSCRGLVTGAHAIRLLQTINVRKMADNGLQVIAASVEACNTRPISHLTSSSGTEPVTDGRPTISSVTCESSVSFRPKKERAGNLLNHGGVAYVAGLGFGLMGCIFELLPNVTVAFGPGVGFETWKSKTFFVVAAFEVMCLSLLQIFWSIILFEAYKRKSYGHIIVIISTHVLVSCLSLLNQFNYPWPEVVCTVYLLSLLAAAVYTYANLGNRHCNVRQFAAQTSNVT
ncbi:hypothetical protein PHET_07573 [Paragonimus heterotremus]|uniref:Uncharacterized protein n=1 Tax=Paragonimus heterotremus TaxID=100268 RepID=A0A8J4SLW0_9TREM|nr:hypothetical protein PHET_07573 [Paragonimus heterotremus]